MRDYETVKEYTDELVPLSSEGGFIYWWGHGIFYQGERKALEGQVDEGIAQMNKALETLLATGTETCMTRLNARLAEACVKVNRVEEGLAAIDRAFGVLNRHNERYYEAELHRLKGELLLIQDGTSSESEVESCYQKALEVSRSLKAKSLELRAAMSLSRLKQKQGKKEEARKLLQQIYGWFTEGFDTGDLKEAKALIDELS